MCVSPIASFTVLAIPKSREAAVGLLMAGTFPYTKLLCSHCVVFLFTAEEDMNNVVKCEGTGEGWRRVIQACGWEESMSVALPHVG